MPPLFDLIIDLPNGMATAQVYAKDGQQAFELGRKLYPGCRLAAVAREDEEEAEAEAEAEAEELQEADPPD